MIIIGEKINGSIASVAKAIAGRDAGVIKRRAEIQAGAGADFIDCCASVPETRELETLQWMIENIESVTDRPISIDSPSPRVCVEAMKFCARPGLINSASLESDKIDTIFPAIAGTQWQCVTLLCDDSGIPDTADKRLAVFRKIMLKAGQYGLATQSLHIDPLVVTLATDPAALATFAECARVIKNEYPDIHITSGLSNISFGLPGRRVINQAALVLALNAGMDSAIVDPADQAMAGLIYAAEALLQKDKRCKKYIQGFRKGLFGGESKGVVQPGPGRTA